MGVESELARRAIVVLDDDVNPSIASHGGQRTWSPWMTRRRWPTSRCRVVGQGCSMSRMTLSQGIETALRAAIPELTDVRDITDHASGVNPFYADAH